MSDSKNEIKKMWRIIGTSDSSVLELRAIWPTAIKQTRPALTTHFRATNHGGIDACKLAFEAEALRLNAIGYNIYVVMNPINPTFTGYAAEDGDIAHRDLLLIDIDRAQTTKQPANDEEVEAAKQLADTVKAYLETMEWPDPIRVMSGNGHHLYYVMPDFANDDASKQCVKQLLKSLSRKFDNETVKIDTSVYNASRVTKVVGTIARKGLESEGRPYRMARVI